MRIHPCRGSVKALLLTTLFVCQALPQEIPAHFEVASVKPSPKRVGSAAMVKFTDGKGRLSYENVTLNLLISIAHEIDIDKIQSRQDWTDTSPYDVTAVFPPETTKAQTHAMLRSLLAERLRVVVHKISKETSGMELYADPKGTSLKPSTVETDAQVNILRGRIVCAKISMPTLAAVISSQLHRPVVDKTEISGNFEIDLRWAADAVDGVSETGDSLYSALKDKLGLRLRPGKATVVTLVLDHANKEPSEP